MILVTSCKTSNDVVSSKLIQKRKYRSGFYVNNNKKEKEKRDELLITNQEVLYTDEVLVENGSNLESFLEIENNQIEKLRKEKEAKKVSSLNSDDELEISSNKASKKMTKLDKKLQKFKKNKSYFANGDDPPKKKLEIIGLIGFISVILAIILAFTGLWLAVLILFGLALLLSIISLTRFGSDKNKFYGKAFPIATLVILLLFIGLLVLYAIAYG